ncbi:hypothetical protein ASC97_07740 [Rhizobium sp. Root1203]|nr:hypothetical protein ASC97_07740 [Rhizobium sp. Root1203]
MRVAAIVSVIGITALAWSFRPVEPPRAEAPKAHAVPKRTELVRCRSSGELAIGLKKQHRVRISRIRNGILVELDI